MERNDNLIKKKIYKYMVTGVMTTIALQLGNVVDAMIVGNLIGSLGNGAITASTPYLYILQAATILLGSGGAVMVAILLGRRDIDSAGRVMGFCMLFSILYPLIFTILTPVVVPAFLGLTGATGEYFPGLFYRITLDPGKTIYIGIKNSSSTSNTLSMLIITLDLQPICILLLM